MAMFPKVQSPCPLKAQAAAMLDGEHCRACDRRVHDLTAMTDAQRVAFVKSSGGEACVSYVLPATAVAAIAAVAAAATPLPALAQAAPAPLPATVMAPEASSPPTDSTMVELLVMGGITDPDTVEFVADDPEPAAPELPVVFDDDESSPPAPAGGQT